MNSLIMEFGFPFDNVFKYIMYNLAVNTCHVQYINSNDVKCQHFVASLKGVFEDNILHRFDTIKHNVSPNILSEIT